MKTDGLDAKALCLRLDRFVQGNRDALAVVRVPSEEEEQLRALHRQREQLVKARKQLEAQGRSLMVNHGIEPVKNWWKRRTFAALAVPEWMKELLCNSQPILVELQEKVGALTVQLQAAAASEQPRGLGAMSSVVIDREIGDWNRFSNRRQVALAVARFLEDAGRPVALVGVIDADLRWTGKDYLKKEFLRRHIIEMYGTFTRELGLLKPLDEQALAEFATQLAGDISQASQETRIEGVLRSIAAHGYISPGLPDSLLKHYLSLFLSHSDFLGDCAPTVISAPLAMWSGTEARSESSG